MSICRYRSNSRSKSSRRAGETVRKLVISFIRMFNHASRQMSARSLFCLIPQYNSCLTRTRHRRSFRFKSTSSPCVSSSFCSSCITSNFFSSANKSRPRRRNGSLRRRLTFDRRVLEVGFRENGFEGSFRLKRKEVGTRHSRDGRYWKSSDTSRSRYSQDEQQFASQDCLVRCASCWRREPLRM